MTTDPPLRVFLRPRASLAFAFPPQAIALTTAFLLSACGHCDGALRTMRAESYSAPRPDANGRFPLAARASFQIRADGPSEVDGKLRELSGVNEGSWQLFADSTGEPVPPRCPPSRGATHASTVSLFI
jgi:hypothetical protein